MSSKDPKLVALQFNEYINNHDIASLSNLMTEDHTFIDRKGEVDKGKNLMIQGWMKFFKQFPDYRNFFLRVESRDDLVIILGYAIWEKGEKKDHAIWIARIRDNRVAEWRIYEDTKENRKKFNLL